MRVQAIAALGFVVVLPALFSGYAADDFLHLAALNGPPPIGGPLAFLDLFDLSRADPDRLLVLRDAGSLPWTTDPELRLGFLRPLSGLTHGVDHWLAPGQAWFAHLHSALWYGLAAATAFLAYRRLDAAHRIDVAAAGPTHSPSAGPLARWLGGAGGGAGGGAAAWVTLAALLWTLNDDHGYASGWIAGRNGVITAAFGFLALERHVARRSWAAAGALGLGLLAGEAAVATFAYLAAWSALVDLRPVRERLRSWVPLGLVAAGWLAVWVGGGYGTSGTGMYVDPTDHPGLWLQSAAIRWPVLVGATWFMAAPLVQPVARADLWAPFALASLVAAGLVLALARDELRRDRVAVFLLVGSLLAAVPFVGTTPSGRMMLFPAFGATGLVARVIVHSARRWVQVVLLGLHGLVPAVMLVPGLLTIAGTNELLVDPLAGGAWDQDPQKDLVLIDAPNLFFAAYGPAVRMARSEPVPPHLRVIAPSWQDLEVERTDERTLVVRPEHGWLVPLGTSVDGEPPVAMEYLLQTVDTVVRGRPFAAGERIVLPGVEIEVTERRADGMPLVTTWRFDEPLESYAWGQWDRRSYVVWAPPAVGATVRLEGEAL